MPPVDAPHPDSGPAFAAAAGTAASHVSAIAGAPALRPRLHFGRLDRYILRELAVPFALTFVLASLLLVSGEFLREIIDKWMNRGLGLAVAWRVLWYLLPPLLIFTIPVALLLAILVSFGRLSEDHEIVAMQAAGVSWQRLFGPVLAIGLVASVFNCWLANAVIPIYRYQSREFLVQTLLAHPTLLLEPQTWLRKVDGMHVWVGDIDDASGELRDLRIYRDDPDGGTQTITAATGRIEVEPADNRVTLELHDGTMHQADAADPDAYTVLEFRSVRIPFPIYVLHRWAERASGEKLSEKPLGELLQYTRADASMARRAWQEIANRTALPFACFSFVLIGAPLGIRPHRSVHAYGAVLSIALALVFFLLYSVGEALSREGAVHPLVGLWLPNLLVSGAGIVAMKRVWQR